MLKNKNILVTGGTGFVGSYVLRSLINKGYKNVFCLKRKSSNVELLSPIEKEISFIEGDLNDIPSLEAAIDQVDIVIHCAAIVSFKAKDRDLMMKVNVEGTANLVNICNSKDIEKFVYISSIASLGRNESGKIIDEKTDWVDSNVNSDYAISKYLSEMEVWRAFAEGLPVVILNPSLILGAGFWKVGTGELFKKIYSGLKVYPTGTNGFVDVRDVAKMVVVLMESKIEGERFICSAENLKFIDVLTQIAKILDRKPPKIKLSKTFISIASVVLNFLNLIPGYSSNLTSQSVKNASFDSIYDNSKSIEKLGYSYISISKTIRETGELFKKTYTKGIKYALLDI